MANGKQGKARWNKIAFSENAKSKEVKCALIIKSLSSQTFSAIFTGKSTFNEEINIQHGKIFFALAVENEFKNGWKKIIDLRFMGRVLKWIVGLLRVEMKWNIEACGLSSEIFDWS